MALLLLVCLGSCIIKRRLEKRISELEAPMLSESDQEMVSVESTKLRPVSSA